MPTGAFSKFLAITFLISVTGMIVPGNADAQNSDMQAVTLKKQAMTAYGDLDLENAVSLLDQAAAMGAQLSAATVAQIYVSYGLVYVGGHGDNARGQEYFTVARCLDSMVQIDPLFSTPEVDLIFRMAQSRATPQACPGMLANVQFMRGGAVPPAVQPAQPSQPMQPGMLPPCGMHNAPVQQRKSNELPLGVQVPSNKLASLNRMVIKYAYDGAATFFEMEMNKATSGWVTGLLSCDEGQITAFDPSSISYYIEGYDMAGGLVCGHGSAGQPFTVTMDPNAAVVSGVPGMPPPQTCTECPPWDQDCHASSGQGLPCFADDECLEGQWCADTGFCEGEAVGGDDTGGGGWGDEPAEGGSTGSAGPKKFYLNFQIGTGAGYASVPKAVYRKVSYDPDNIANTVYTWAQQGATMGGWGGLGVRATMGFMTSPKFSLELGFRLDVSSAWRTQKTPEWCDQEHESVTSDNYTCFNNRDGEVFGLLGWDENGTTRAKVTEELAVGKSWLLNFKGRYRFVNKGKLQASFFGGLGFGHLFFNTSKGDVDLDGTADPRIATPGMINVELGPGIAYYPSKNFGFIFDLPIDMVFGEDGSFGMNGEISIGISFGG